MLASKFNSHSRTSWWIDSLFLLIFLGVIFFLWLGSRPLFVPDEGRYAEIAREMAASGNYITPYLNGIKYFEKPVLFYWLGAFAIKFAGLSLWTLRSINACLALAGCLLTYWVSRHLYDRLTGLLAALILGTSTLFFVMSHMIGLDLPVSIFISASLYFFLLGSKEPCRSYFWAAAISAALAVLSKGLIGIVFPAIIAGMWICLTSQWKILRQAYLLSSSLIFLVIVTPWHYLVNLYNPEFFHFYFIEQHLLRYTTKDIGHYQPSWFFLPYLMLGLFPWCVFLPQTITRLLPLIWKQRQTYQKELFFLLWAVFIFSFFSFSKSKLIPYILPVFPPLAVLIARYLSTCLRQKQVLGLRLSYSCLLLLSLLLYAAYLYFMPHNSYLSVAACILVFGALIANVLIYWNAIYAYALTIITAGLFLSCSLASLSSLDSRTILPLAKSLKPLLRAQDEVITYNQYYQDLPFYLQRRVSILNWRNELGFGMAHQDTGAWMIQDKVFWQRFHSEQRVFVLMSISEYQTLRQNRPNEKIYLLAKTPTNVLISNKNKP